MSARMALAAITFLFVWSGPNINTVCAQPADSLPADANGPRRPYLDRTRDSHVTLKGLQSVLRSVPDNSVKSHVLPILDKLEAATAQLPQAKRQDFIAQNLTDLNSATMKLSPQSTPKDLLKKIQNDTAYLNNRANNWAQSCRLCAQVLRHDPDNQDALVTRANANYGLKNFKSAFDDADAAAKLDPNNSDAYTARALSAWGLNDYLQTLEDAQHALALNPNDRTAHALMRLAEGRVPPLAIRDEKTRLEIAVQREYHGMLQQITQVEQKRQELAGSPVRPTLGQLIRNAARKISLKDYRGAITDADKALAEDPNSTAAYYYRCAAFNLLGQYQDAIANANQALTLDPNETAVHDARAYAYNHLGRFQDALADANHSLELNPKNPYAYANRGFAHEKIGNLEAMFADLKKAAELNPQFEPVYHDAAATYDLPLPQAAPPTHEPAPVVYNRHRQFLVILASSLVGGFLIALGLFHIFGIQMARKIAKAQAPQATHALRPLSSLEATYEIGKTLGQGGMGVVHEAWDKALKRKVAIKMLLDETPIDSQTKERFIDEARTVAALHHPNIVDIHSIFADAAGLYLVFEFIAGQTLADLLLEKHKLPLAEAKTLVRPVCAALDFAHRHNVVHRDLKPANIMLTVHGQVKVMDFGISRHIPDTRDAARPGVRKYTVTNSPLGTPYYMAPEQEYGAVRPESDIYSLGTCLYEMICGQRPYPPPASNTQKLSQNYPRPSTIDPSLPRSLDVLIDEALHPDPEKRIGSAAHFWSLLETIRGSDAIISPS